MKRNRTLEQHIAVFGESGSGKTVLVSSFYGAAQEAQNIKKSQLNIVAENFGHGAQLSRNYLGMKNTAKLPPGTTRKATSYSFKIQLKSVPGAGPTAAGAFDALRLVWHDYPGEWFEKDVSGPTEAKRRVDTFTTLLGSDVALLLVDGQRLLENVGQEERYLKSLITEYRTGLLSLKNDVLDNGKPMVKFPRIWIMALSKSDLLPHLNAFDFRDLLLEKASPDLSELHDVLAEFVESSAALSVGEDFLLLSSAKFSPSKIEVGKRVGVDLIMPVAAILPLERHLRWAQMGNVSRKVAISLLTSAELIALGLGVVGGVAGSLLGHGNKLFHVAGLILRSLGPGLSEALKKAETKLKGKNAVALKKQNTLAATLRDFRTQLIDAENEEILLTSKR